MVALWHPPDFNAETFQEITKNSVDSSRQCLEVVSPLVQGSKFRVLVEEIFVAYP